MKAPGIYVNPWSKLKKKDLKIITLDSAGAVQEEKLGKPKFLDMKSRIEARMSRNEHKINKKNMGHNHMEKFHDPGFIEEVQNLVSYFLADRKSLKLGRLKILTYCNKMQTACRFLACPNIRVSCKLCDVSWTSNRTKCETFSTTYLF